MAVSRSRNARELAFALEVKSTKIFENALLQNGVLATLGSLGRVKITRGGNRFDERVHLGQNSTVGHRGKYTQIPTDRQSNWQEAQFGQAVCSGAAVINLVELDQAQGEHKLDDLAQKSLDDCMIAFPNELCDALMKASPSSSEPDSVKSTIEATAFGSQTSITGGLSRSTYSSDPGAWQNQYTNTAVSDLGAAAGIRVVSKFLWDCSHGSAQQEQPDIFLTTTGVFAMATGGGDANRRYAVNDRMLKLGFNSRVPSVTWEGNELCFVNVVAEK